MDGQLEKHNLGLSGKSEKWLMQQLSDNGFADRHDVLLCYLDTNGVMSLYGYDGGQPVRFRALSENEVIW